MGQQWFDIPERPSGAPTGSEFIKQVEAANVGTSEERDRMFEEQFLAGNVPSFLRIVHPVKVGDRITIYVLADYLALGTDEDFVIASLNPMTAQRICDAWGGGMPTRKEVDTVWKAADSKLDPQPWGPPYDSSMMSTYRIEEHTRRIRGQFDSKGYKLGTLTGGSKKDVVICHSIQPPANAKVAIYGWHQSNGQPIQGPSIQDTEHEITYRDYSHGIRIISNVVTLDGAQDDRIRVLKDPELVPLLSDERKGNDGIRVDDADPFTDPRYVTSLAVA